MTIRAVLFDLDGTIGDTLPLCLAAFRKAIEPLAGRTFSDQEIIDTFGPSEEGTIYALLPKDKCKEGLHRYWHWYTELHSMCPAPFAGMKKTMESLRRRGAFVGLVTGKGKVSADVTLKLFGMDTIFEDAEFGWEHGPRKPDALRAILARNNLDAKKTLYVGDAPSDIEASREVGIGVLAAAWAETAEPERLRELAPDGLFFTVEEFAKYIEQLPVTEKGGRR